MRDVELLIFDWDGTLCDSVPRIVAAMQSAALDCGIAPADADAVRAIIGMSLDEAIRLVHPDLHQDSLAPFIRAYGARYLEADAVQPSPLFPGVADALAAYAAAGYRMAVATGKSRRGLDRVLAQRGWTRFFDVTRCADESAGKPDPRMLHEILSYCDVPASRAVMVGDSLFDLEMAHRAGVRSIAVTYGAQPAERLQSARPTHVIDQFAALTDWLMCPQQSGGVNEHVG